ncbi:proline-rich protein 3-like [Tripterygium wilfordii]|uniref:proline-rich protein 3-like n=1 Tax=Tripterygium wilfordii TaxID=458696 RepID=UPI0018F7E90F|nr:proline-rich protein 3-like [Tripterygium wilfordii]
MALTRILFPIALLLLSSSLIIASATDYAYVAKPEKDVKLPALNVPKVEVDVKVPEDYIPKPEEDVKYPESNTPKPEEDVKYPEVGKPKIEDVKHPEVEKPKPENAKYPEVDQPKQKEEVNHPEVYKPKPEDVKYPGVDKAKLEEYTGYPEVGKLKPKADVEYPKVSNPKSDEPNTIGVEGLIICRAGSKYFPIQGAVARIACLGINEYGYENTPFSILSSVTDSKGYFFMKFCPSQLNRELKITECKAFLQSSPLETCKVATDVNKGISGALLSSYRILNDNKIKLYTLRPFIYTSETKPNPGGY